jgi:sRNA-binding protein
MTDTPQGPSEATTGTPPAPETLDSADATVVAVAAGEEAASPPDTEPAASKPGDVVEAEAEAAAEHAGAEASADAAADIAADMAADMAADVSADPASGAAPAAPSDVPSDQLSGALVAPAAEAAPPRPELSPAACAALLAEHFPALFSGPPRPLKLRIQADIQARAPGLFTRKSLSVFLHRHTTTNAYLNALVKAPQRVDLDGADAGEIADEHKAAAVEELARRKAVHETRRREARATENAARRAAAQPAPRSAPGSVDTPDTAGAASGEAAAASPPADAAHPGSDTPRHERPPSAQRPVAPARQDQARPAREARRDSRTDRPQRQNERPQASHTEARPDQRTDMRREAPGRPPMRAERPAPSAHSAHSARSAQTPSSASAQPAQPAQPAFSEAERERAALLRAYEGSTLTSANFCVLKRIGEAALEAQLLLARQERALRPAAPARPEHRNEGRADFRPDFRPGPGAGPRPSRGGDADGPRGPRRPRPPPPGR